ncbi:hypothetical protein O7627_22460 [Solwaraspora sp. WMMD1047]|uniref:endonuclease domain-containing protein n=1 Tax=Solwaraspora sp. WMMD1047 TaxID=3016102 RepID=UPI00241714F0|nr:hypothetical protein [Solwaraspora sp. WMMD1047]MDG4832048.1 hypothetical protein [Solwaraspora sp. WMMD1047]
MAFFTSGKRAERAVPGDDADELTWLLFRQDEVLAGRQARQHLTASAVRHRVRSGRWRRVHRDVYVTHSGPVSAEQRLWIAVLACGQGSALAGLTAAARCGLKGFGERTIHLVRPAQLRTVRPPRGVVVHRSGTLAEEDVNSRGLPPYTTNARSLVDAAAWAATDDRARAVIAAGFQQRLVGGDDIHRLVSRLPTLRRRALILATADDACGGSESLPELRYLQAARRAGLPEPNRQHRRRDASGRIRYLDVYYERWRVHVEIDGGHHLDVRAQWADMARQNDLWIAGDRVLRFPAWLVRDRPADVIAQVRQALLAAGWCPDERR